MTCIDSRLLALPSPHVWMNQWSRRCSCRRADRGCFSFRKIYVYISLCAVQNVVYIDCLAPPCFFIQSGSQIECRLLKQWNKAQAGVTADTRHSSLPSADVTFKTKPVSSLTYGRIVLASRTIACCHCATDCTNTLTLWEKQQCRFLCFDSAPVFPPRNEAMRLSCAPTNHSVAHGSPAPLTEWTNHSLKRNVFPLWEWLISHSVFPHNEMDHFPTSNQRF